MIVNSLCLTLLSKRNFKQCWSKIQLILTKPTTTKLNARMTLIITILIDNIFLDAFVLQKDDAIEESIVTFFFSENLILISSVDAGYEF